MEGIVMALLVTSASGANGAGYGCLLAFDQDGELLGSFSEDARIVDPRGLGVDGDLLFLNSGSNRILALDVSGRVVRDTGTIPKLNPGGGNFGPDGQYYVGLRSARTILAFVPTLDGPGEAVLPPAVVPFRVALDLLGTARSFSRPASDRAAKATIRSLRSDRNGRSTLLGRSKIRRWARLTL
jgi:hypothetical protein